MTAPKFPPAAHPDTPPSAAGGAPRVCGLDLSLTGTGIAACDGSLLFTVRPKASGDARLAEIRDVIAEAVMTADLVVLEDLPTHAHAAGITGMVQGIARVACLDAGVPYATVPAATLKKYATGRGNATKPDMRMELYRRAGLDLRDDNQVDAWFLRAAGLDHLGAPIIALPQAHRDALTKVTWPAITEEVRRG